MKLQTIAREFGRGKGTRTTFATLADAAKYIKDRWQGAEYSDGPASFHTDFCTYELRGFTLAEIGKFTFEGEDRVFTFNSDAKPAPELTPADAYDAATHRAECADMSNPDGSGFDPRAPFPHASDPHWSDPRADFANW